MNPVTAFLVCVTLGVGAALTYSINPFLGLPFLVLAVVIGLSLKMANTWQKFVILRMGKLQSVKGAGLFAIIPVIDNVVAVIDGRIQTTAFNAEQALTKDTVPVNVDAIIFWHVHDAEKAALAITNYREAIDRVAQTTLREMIGTSMLAALLSDRKEADEQLLCRDGTVQPAGTPAPADWLDGHPRHRIGLLPDVRVAAWGIRSSRAGDDDLRVGDGSDIHCRAWHFDASPDEALCARYRPPPLSFQSASVALPNARNKAHHAPIRRMLLLIKRRTA